MACDPAEMALIASSTSTGVFDMTRTTGTSTGIRRSMNDVVMPAATETSSWSDRDEGRDLVQKCSHVLRLDGDDHGACRLHCLGIAR